MAAPAPQGPGLPNAEPSVNATTELPGRLVRYSVVSLLANCACSLVLVLALPKSFHAMMCLPRKLLEYKNCYGILDFWNDYRCDAGLIVLLNIL